jgi:hypothetical protein
MVLIAPGPIKTGRRPVLQKLTTMMAPRFPEMHLRQHSFVFVETQLSARS